jgi:hypothetical protein
VWTACWFLAIIKIPLFTRVHLFPSMRQSPNDFYFYFFLKSVLFEKWFLCFRFPLADVVFFSVARNICHMTHDSVRFNFIFLSVLQAP